MMIIRKQKRNKTVQIEYPAFTATNGKKIRKKGNRFYTWQQSYAMRFIKKSLGFSAKTKCVLAKVKV